MVYKLYLDGFLIVIDRMEKQPSPPEVLRNTRYSLCMWWYITHVCHTSARGIALSLLLCILYIEVCVCVYMQRVHVREFFYKHFYTILVY